MINEIDGEFNELDRAAKANLTAKGYVEYLDYKKELLAEGVEPNSDIKDILCGFIWDETEVSNE